MAADMEKIEMILMENEERLEKTLSVLKSDLLSIRVGRANPHVLDKVMVDYYGELTPINQVGNMSVVDGQCLVIAPWDASMLKVIEKQLLADNIGITPSNDGKVIRLVFPVLTEERRKEIVKTVKKIGEDSKVSIRSIRRDSMDKLKAMKKDSIITEDDQRDGEKQLQDITDKYVKEVDGMYAKKEKEILEI